MAVMISAYLVRASRVHNRPVSVVASGQGADFTAAMGQDVYFGSSRYLWCRLWQVRGTLLHLDAVNGGQTAWPVYLFAGVAVVCAVVWGLLAAKISGDGEWELIRIWLPGAPHLVFAMW